MDILFLTVTFLAVVISIALILIGAKKKVNSCLSIGVITLLITAIAVVSYFFDWYIPLIIIFGTAGMMFTSMGTYGENSKDYTRIGLIQSVVGVVFLLIAFYYWYQGGWYTSLGIATCLTSVIFFLNGAQNVSDHLPILSLSVGVLFALITIYLWIFLELNGHVVFIGGFLGGLFLKAMWSVFYEKNY